MTTRPMRVRVASVNLLNDPSRWPERRGLLAGQLAEGAFDLIGLQEVVNPRGDSTAHWLARELGGYEVLVSPKAGWSRAREGIAILSRLPVEGHEVLDLRGQERTAQLVRVRVGGTPLAFANGHYYWPPIAHAARTRQVLAVARWLEGLPEGTAVAACGDFNGTPDSPAIVAMKQRFTSAHEARHGREPDFTCPTPLATGGRVRSALTRAAYRLFADRPGGSWRGTLDYIFVNQLVRVAECGLILDRPSPDDPSLYASDHFGLGATLEIVASGP